MKSFQGFISEATGVPLLAKKLKKRFKGTKDVARTDKKVRLKGSIISSVTIPKVKPTDVQKFLQSLGYKTEESFEGFIDMYMSDYKSNATHKATIVSNDNFDGVEVRVSSHAQGKSSKSCRKDTFSNQNAINQNKFSGKSPRYR